MLPSPQWLPPTGWPQNFATSLTVRPSQLAKLMLRKMRTYDELLWASTDVQSDSVTDAGSIAFGRLFGYLSGANENSQTIDMTSPVLNKISPGSGPNCNNTFTVSFFVPYKYQTAEGPPKPTADDVYIQKIKISDVAVSVFGGFAEDSDVVSTGRNCTATLMTARTLTPTHRSRTLTGSQRTIALTPLETGTTRTGLMSWTCKLEK